MVFITIKGEKNLSVCHNPLSVCNAIHSQSSAWCSPQVSCPWLLPMPSGLRHFHIQAEVPMKTKQRYLCRATATKETLPIQKETWRCLAEGSLRTFRLQPRLQRKSPYEPVRKKRVFGTLKKSEEDTRTECRWRRTGQDSTASNKF